MNDISPLAKKFLRFLIKNGGSCSHQRFEQFFPDPLIRDDMLSSLRSDGLVDVTGITCESSSDWFMSYPKGFMITEKGRGLLHAIKSDSQRFWIGFSVNLFFSLSALALSIIALIAQ